MDINLVVRIMKLTEALREIKEFCQRYPIEHKDDFNPMIESGGNYDDCYQIGCTHGEQVLANSVLTIISGHDLEDI